MPFQENLMIQTQENGEKTQFGSDLGQLGPKSILNFFPFFSFSKIWLHQSLDIMVKYHHVQYQKKLMI